LLELERVLGLLSRVDWRGLGAEWVVVFGGLAGRGRGRDVDLLVAGPVDVFGVVEAVARAGLDPGLVDVVPLSRAPCEVILDAWKRGILVYEWERGVARRSLLARVIVCHDYRLMAEKLGVLERGPRRMRERWSR